MGEAFLTRRGGGSSADVSTSDFAIICAKFPEGSTCTCSKSGTTFTAANAPGLAAFPVSESGTWTVAITDGTRIESTTVSVSEGDIKTVTLAYTPATLTILSPEDGLASGYSVSGGASVTNNTVAVNGSGGYITPAIDLTNYTTLTIVCQTTYLQTQNPSKIFVDTDASKYSNYFSNFALSKDCDVDINEHTYTLDVSSLSGAHYIGEAASATNFVFKSIVLS